MAPDVDRKVVRVDRELDLQPLASTHLDGMWAALEESAGALRGTMPWWRDEQTLDDMARWIAFTESAWTQRSLFAFAIVAGGQYVGAASLEGIDWNRLSANMSYRVRTARTNRGVASRAMRALARWACIDLGLQRVEVSMVTSNAASSQAARKADAQFEGILRNKARSGAQSRDMAMFSFIPSDFSGHSLR